MLCFLFLKGIAEQKNKGYDENKSDRRSSLGKLQENPPKIREES